MRKHLESVLSRIGSGAGHGRGVAGDSTLIAQRVSDEILAITHRFCHSTRELAVSLKPEQDGGASTTVALRYDRMAFEVAAFCHFCMMQHDLFAAEDGQSAVPGRESACALALRHAADLSASVFHRNSSLAIDNDAFFRRVISYAVVDAFDRHPNAEMIDFQHNVIAALKVAGDLPARDDLKVGEERAKFAVAASVVLLGNAYLVQLAEMTADFLETLGGVV